VISAASAKAAEPSGQSNPIVPNASEESGGAVAEFQAPQRAMGKTGLQVRFSAWAASTLAPRPDSRKLITWSQKLSDHGINFFDNAWEYYKGASEERVGNGAQGQREKAIGDDQGLHPRAQKKMSPCGCLEESLTRLQTDFTWMFGSARSGVLHDPESVTAPEGVLKPWRRQAQGKVRFVGFTGHKIPSIPSSRCSKWRFPRSTLCKCIEPIRL